MNLLTFTTTINKIKITAELSYHALTNGKIIEENKVYEIIKAEFNTDYSFYEIAQHILNSLQPFCYKVEIEPPTRKARHFADDIIEITNQGEYQLTIVADINKNDV